MSEAADFPRRLVLGGKSHGPIEIYGDDSEFMGHGNIASAPPEGGMAYICEDIYEESLRLNDAALAAIVVLGQASDDEAFQAASKALLQVYDDLSAHAMLRFQKPAIELDVLAKEIDQ